MKRKPQSYERFIKMPYPRPGHRTEMSLELRGIQFSSFEALTGLDDTLSEEGRFTLQRYDLSEEEKLAISTAIAQLELLLPKRPQVTLMRFLEDPFKEGGEYLPMAGILTEISQQEQWLRLDDEEIPFADIYALDSPLLQEGPL